MTYTHVSDAAEADEFDDDLEEIWAEEELYEAEEDEDDLWMEEQET